MKTMIHLVAMVSLVIGTMVPVNTTPFFSTQSTQTMALSNLLPENDPPLQPDPNKEEEKDKKKGKEKDQDKTTPKPSTKKGKN